METNFGQLGIVGDLVLIQPLEHVSLSRVRGRKLLQAATVIGRVVHHDHRLLPPHPLSLGDDLGTGLLEIGLEHLGIL